MGACRRAFERLHGALHSLRACLEAGEGTSFAFDPQLGYLTSCPSKLGTAMRLSVTAKLPALAGHHALLLEAMARRLGLVATLPSASNGLRAGEVQLSNAAVLGPSEVELLEAVVLGVHTVCEMEKAAARHDRARLDLIMAGVPQQWAPRAIPNLKDVQLPAPRPGYRPALLSGA